MKGVISLYIVKQYELTQTEPKHETINAVGSLTSFCQLLSLARWGRKRHFFHFLAPAVGHGFGGSPAVRGLQEGHVHREPDRSAGGIGQRFAGYSHPVQRFPE